MQRGAPGSFVYVVNPGGTVAARPVPDRQQVRAGQDRQGEALGNWLDENREVLIANGYYDLATPHFATQYTVSHMGLDPEVRENVSLTFYEAGHMMYVHQPSLRQLATDLRDFVKTTS